MNENEETKINNGDYTPIKRTPTIIIIVVIIIFPM